MTPRRERGASLTGLLSLSLLYLILIVLVLAFASQLLNDLSFAQSNATRLILAMALLFPALLLGILVIRIVRLIRDRSQGRPGARLKGRLLLFFLVIVLLASIPQAVLSVTFIRTAVQTWFSEDTGRAIAGGQEIALSFFAERETNLLRFADGEFMEVRLAETLSNPQRAWRNIAAANPTIDAFQVFDAQMREVFAGGDASLHLDPGQAAAARLGQVARESIGGVTFLRIRKNAWDRSAGDPGDSSINPTRTVILSVSLPDGFDAAATRLTQALEFFVQLDRFQGDFVAAIGLFYGFFAVPLVMLAMLVSFLLSDEILRPIVSLEEATRRVAEGDFSTRILTKRGDELSLLVNSFNRMVGELARTREKIIQTEKIAAWQEIAQRLAHEVKNPLTPIRLAAERTLRKYSTGSPDFPAVLEASVRAIVSEVDNLSDLLTEFRAFSRLPAPSMARMKLLPLVEEIEAAYVVDRVAERVVDVPPELELDADKAQIRQVFSNLVKNAVEAAGPQGRVAVRADYIIKEAGAHCRIQIEDNGQGIALEHQKTVFDPYMTTKEGGTGLGLAIVQRIVFDHGGQIWFETQPRVGTTFFIDLPVVSSRKETSG
ncbi:MAG: ATP-binding protein [Spirochaetales bacterium]